MKLPTSKEWETPGVTSLKEWGHTTTVMLPEPFKPSLLATWHPLKKEVCMDHSKSCEWFGNNTFVIGATVMIQYDISRLCVVSSMTILHRTSNLHKLSKPIFLDMFCFIWKCDCGWKFDFCTPSFNLYNINLFLVSEINSVLAFIQVGIKVVLLTSKMNSLPFHPIPCAAIPPSIHPPPMLPQQWWICFPLKDFWLCKHFGEIY